MTLLGKFQKILVTSAQWQADRGVLQPTKPSQLRGSIWWSWISVYQPIKFCKLKKPNQQNQKHKKKIPIKTKPTTTTKTPPLTQNKTIKKPKQNQQKTKKNKTKKQLQLTKSKFESLSKYFYMLNSYRRINSKLSHSSSFEKRYMPIHKEIRKLNQNKNKTQWGY